MYTCIIVLSINLRNCICQSNDGLASHIQFAKEKVSVVSICFQTLSALGCHITNTTCDKRKIFPMPFMGECCIYFWRPFSPTCSVFFKNTFSFVIFGELEHRECAALSWERLGYFEAKIYYYLVHCDFLAYKYSFPFTAE